MEEEEEEIYIKSKETERGGEDSAWRGWEGEDSTWRGGEGRIVHGREGRGG